MKNKLIISRIICMVLVFSVTVSAVVTPASAADPDLFYENILPADSYTKMIDMKYQNTTSVSPTYFFREVHDCGWKWDARTYEHTFSTIIFTIYCTGNLSLENAGVYFSFYDGRRIKAELVGNYNYFYYQYRVDYQSNLAVVSIEAEFPDMFTGNFAIHSCVGIKDIGYKLNRVNYQESASMIKTGTAVLVNEPVLSLADQPLPVGHMSKRTDQYQTWYHDTVFVTGDFSGASNIDSLTFIGYGLTPDLITFTLLDSSGWPIYAPDFDDIGAKISTSIGSWGDHDWDVVFWQIDIDLSGYDLDDCMWELSFQIEPMPYKTGMSFTDWNLAKIIARLPVENPPWYKTFFNWISVKWDSVTKSIVNEIKNVGKKLDDLVVSPAVKEQLNDAAESMDNKTNQITDYNDRFQSVEKPNVSSSDLLDPVLSRNNIGLAIMTSITSQEIVARLLLVVFTFSMIAYVFFGKR